jgi:glycosyltransferase involved in cell wall biosynthesis
MDEPLKILLLAPHPFYQERGTPIAVDLLLSALSKRGHKIEVITFHEGVDHTYPNVTLHRIPKFSFIKGIGPGFSLKKIFCDVFVFFKAFRQVLCNRPNIIHAVEESVYMALLFRAIFRVPYVYDMDSSMAAQLVEKMPGLKFLSGFFQWWEGLAIRRAQMVIPVCQALAQIAKKEGARSLRILNDISLLQPTHEQVALRKDYPTTGTVFMYIGNLEGYQGIDMMIDAFALASAKKDMTLFIVGGTPEHIEKYRRMAQLKGCGTKIHLVGPRSPSLMSALFAEADVLVSPRIKGENTPMKIYSYLDSGKAVLATRLPTHTQVIEPDTALLAEPTPEAFAEGMLALASDESLRQQLAARAKELVQQKYSRDAFERTVNSIYDSLESELKGHS